MHLQSSDLSPPNPWQNLSTLGLVRVGLSALTEIPKENGDATIIRSPMQAKRQVVARAGFCQCLLEFEFELGEGRPEQSVIFEP
jgi:hypothetical protein